MSMMQLGMGFAFEAQDLASGVIDRVGSKLVELKGRATDAGQGIAKGLGEFGAGMAVVGAGLAGLSALHPAIEAAGQFEKRVTEITTLTDEATLGFDSVSNAIKNMNAEFGGGTAAQAKAFYDGISAGASNLAEANSLVAASNKLAVAGVTEVNVALDGLTSSLNAYGESFENASQFSDAMFVAVQKGKTKIEEISHVIGRVAPTASALGVSFDELTASLAAVTTKGLKTEEAATGIKAALANIIKPASDATAEAARLGVKFDAATLRSKGLAGFLKDITSSAQFNKDSLAKLFGSVEGLNAVLALTADNSKAFTETLDAMANKGGATDKAFDKMSNTWAFQQKRLDGLTENAKILIGEALLPGARAAIDFGQSLLKAFNSLSPATRGFLVHAVVVASTLAVVLGGALAAKAAIVLLGSAGLGLGGVVAAFAPVVAVLGALALAFVVVKQAYENNIGGFGDRINATWSKAKLAVQALYEVFTTGGFSKGVYDQLEDGNKGIENFVIKIYVWANRIENFFDKLSSAFTAAVDEMGPAFSAFGDALDHLGQSLGFLADKGSAQENLSAWERWGRIGALVGKGLALAIEGIVYAITGVIEFTTYLIEGWKDLYAAGETAVGAIRGAWNDVVSFGERAGKAIELVGEIVGLVFGAIGAKVYNYFVEPYVDAFDSVFSSAVAFGASILAAIMPPLQRVGDFVNDVWNGVADAIVGAFAKAWGYAKPILSMLDAALSKVSGVLDSFGVKIGSAAGAAGSSLLGSGLSALGVNEQVTARASELSSVVGGPDLSGIGAGAAASSAAMQSSVASAVREGIAAASASGTPKQIKTELKIDNRVIAEALSDYHASEGDRG